MLEFKYLPCIRRMEVVNARKWDDSIFVIEELTRTLFVQPRVDHANQIFID